MGYLDPVQENETEFPVTLLLRRKYHLYTGQVYINSPTLINFNAEDRTG